MLLKHAGINTSTKSCGIFSTRRGQLQLSGYISHHRQGAVTSVKVFISNMKVVLLVVLIGLCGSGALGEESDFFDFPRNETNPDISVAVEELRAGLKTVTDRVAAAETKLGELEKQNTGNWSVSGSGSESGSHLMDLKDVSQLFTRTSHICSPV